MQLEALTSPLYFVNGDVHEAGVIPGARALSPPAQAAHGRRQDSLFLHLSLTGPPEDSAALMDELLNGFGSCFYGISGSITAALRRAILEMNQALLRHNHQNAGDREGAICCAVLRGAELYVAQVGEALAFIGHSFGVERLPARQPARLTPLGLTAGVDIRYSHHWLEPGDMLLLADPRLAYLQGEALQPVLVDSDIEHGMVALAQLMEHDTARVLLAEFAEELPPNLPQAVDLPSPAPARYRPAAASPLSPATPTSSDGKGATGVNVEGQARKATARAMIGLSLITSGLAKVLAHLRPPPRQEAMSESSWALAGFLAVLIPVVVAGIFTSVYLQRGQLDVFSDVRQQMSQTLGLGNQEPDPARATEYYNAVVEMAATAEAIRPGDGDVERLRREAVAGLDRIQAVTRLAAEPLYSYPDGTVVTAIVLGDELNGDIYTLDSANNRVYRHPTGEGYQSLTGNAPEIIVQGGQPIGNQIAGQIVDMMWRPRSQLDDALALLDRQGMLISYRPDFGQTLAVILGFASEWWARPVNITHFDERLYVLDPGAGAIWRYFPEGENFFVDEAERAVAFADQADLEQVVDLAIYGEDGSIILLYQDGRLRRYIRGRLLWDESDLIHNGLITPLVAPTSVEIAGRGLNSSLFITDPGSQRIVQISLGGTFLAQFKTTDASGQELFASAQDVAVAEGPMRLFFVADNVLYVARQE